MVSHKAPFWAQSCLFCSWTIFRVTYSIKCLQSLQRTLWLIFNINTTKHCKVTVTISLMKWILSAWITCTLNPKKTTFLSFHQSKKNCQRLNLVLGINFSRIRGGKFLGIFVDDKPNFKKHCSYVVSKIISSTYMLRKFRLVFTESQLLQIYHAHIESRLGYGIIIWGVTGLFYGFH